MATTLVYSIPPFVPFTKIVSADMNNMFATIKSRVNWAGGTSSTTGLGDDNLQSNTASGGGLTRATKLKKGTANSVLVNDATGAMSELAVSANQSLFTDGSGVLTSGVLPVSAGGSGVALTLTNPGDVLQVNPGGTALILAVSPVPPAMRMFEFYHYS